MARFTNKVDVKGRVFIPAKLREILGRNVAVTLSLDSGYLSVYTDARFRRIAKQFEDLNQHGCEGSSRQRLIVGKPSRVT